METPGQEPVQVEEQPPVTEKKIFRYQPKYPEGHELAGQAMGGEQVVEYDPTIEDDLANKLVENNVRLQAELRNVKRAAAVAHPSQEEDEIPADAPKASSFHPFQPRDLTPDECVELSRSMADPTKVNGALRKAMTTMLGAAPEQVQRLDQLTVRNYLNSQGQEFRRRHPELDWRTTETPKPVKNKDGKTIGMSTGCVVVDSLLEWCRTRDLASTADNLERGLAQLKKAGLLSEAPIAAEETPGEIVLRTGTRPVVDSTAPATEPSRRPAVRTSALSNRNSQPAAPVVRGAPSWAEIESLTVEQIRAKPAEWRRQAALLFRKLPNEELTRKLRSKVMEQKLDALG
jgi:hypothetical protein